MAIIAYYISENWRLYKTLIAIEHVLKFHFGHNLAILVNCVLQQYGLSERLYAITTDNASNNDTLHSQLAKILASQSIDWSIDAIKIHCLAHVIQLSVKKLLDSIKSSATNNEMINHREKNQQDKIDSQFNYANILNKVRML